MEPALDRNQKILTVRKCLIKVLRFLSNYLPLANAHATDFITHDHWNKFLPNDIQKELIQLNDSQLVQLLSGFVTSSKTHGENKSKSCQWEDVEKASSDNLTGANQNETCIDVDHPHPADAKAAAAEYLNGDLKWEDMCPYFNAAPRLGDTSCRKLHAVKDTPPHWVHATVADFIADAVENSLENLGVLSPLDSVLPQKTCSRSQLLAEKAQENYLPAPEAVLDQSLTGALMNETNGLDNSVSRKREIVCRELATMTVTSQTGGNATVQRECTENGSDSSRKDRTNNSTKEKEDTPFVAYYMSEKKSHEVEVLSALCAHLLKEFSLDLAVDLGSGKGYLGTQLSKQHGIPVVGIDSSVGNTVGAARRQQMVDRQWNGLVRSAREEARTGRKVKKGKKWKSKQGRKTPLPKGSDPQSCHGNLQHGNQSGREGTARCTCCGACSEGTGSLVESGSAQALHSNTEDSSDLKTPPQVTCQPQEEKRIRCHAGQIDVIGNDVDNCVHNGLNKAAEVVPSHVKTEAGVKQNQVVVEKMQRSDWEMSKEEQNVNESNGACCCRISLPETNQTEGTPIKSVINNEDKRNTPFSTQSTEIKAQHTKLSQDHSDSSISTTTSSSACNFLPLTLYVDPTVSLSEVVAESAAHLGVVPGGTGSLLLTGLHTCGGLGATLPRLFLGGAEVRVLAYVGCCHNLLQETFAAESCAETAPDRPSDFPLSAFLTEMEVGLGRTARNLASQSPHRILASGEVPGRGFYRRALLETLLQDLTGGREDWQGLRGVEARSKSLHDYVCRAFRKLGLTQLLDQLTETRVAEYDRRYGDQADKMAAFCQLKAALAPSLEAVVVLDRFLFLLEQSETADVKLVKLFDPVKSPRCYALVAVKR